VLTKLRQITNCLEESFVGRNDNIFTKVAGHCNWNWVAEYHPETSLINAVLGLGLGDFFLSGISG